MGKIHDVMSKQTDIILLAISRGYKVDKQGNVFKEGRLIKGSNTKRGYRKFSIRNLENISYPVMIHRLQAYQKFGDKIFEEGIQVRHIDGNSLNNSWDNIEIGTQSENIMDRSPQCRKRIAITASRKMQDKFRSYDERCVIYEKLRLEIPFRQIEKEEGINRGSLSKIRKYSQEYKEYLMNMSA